MFKIAVGHSEDPDSVDAIKEAIEQCSTILKKDAPNAGILFASPSYDHAPILTYINEQFPNIELIGCTSCAEISATTGHMENSLVLALLYSDRVKIYAGVIHDLSKENDKENYKKEIEKTLKQSDQEPKLCMTFPDILTIGLLAVLKEFETVLGEDFPVVGAGSADMEFKFTETAQFYKTEVLHDSAPFLIFSGPLRFSVEAASGCEPVSPVTSVVEHKDNVVYQIGEYKALDFYKHYLGVGPSMNYPLAIFSDPKKPESYFLRTAIRADEETGSVTFGAAIPENTLLCSVSKIDSDVAINTLKEIVFKINKIKPPFAGAFITSCASRQAVLGTKVKLESEFLKEVYTPEMPCFGYYSYGQISPLETDEKNLVHNQSIVVLAMGEEDENG